LKYSKYLYRIYYSWNQIIKLNREIPNKLNIHKKFKILQKLIKNRNDVENIEKYSNDLNYVYEGYTTNIIDEIAFQINYILKISL